MFFLLLLLSNFKFNYVLCHYLHVSWNPTMTKSYKAKLKTLSSSFTQKQPSRGVLSKRCSENMQQIYRGTPLQLYWNYTSAWVICGIFSEHLLLKTPLNCCFCSLQKDFVTSVFLRILEVLARLVVHIILIIEIKDKKGLARRSRFSPITFYWVRQSPLFRGNRAEVFCEKGILRNFANFTGKLPCLRPPTLLKKTLWHRCFPVNFAKFLRTLFLQNTFGQLLLNKTKWS